MNAQFTDVPLCLRRSRKSRKPLVSTKVLVKVLTWITPVAICMMLILLSVDVYHALHPRNNLTYNSVFVDGKIVTLDQFCSKERLACNDL